jgi:hypothetical protein
VVCDTSVQLKWANLLKFLGLFDGWKKKREHTRTVVDRQKDEIEKLYKGEAFGALTV